MHRAINILSQSVLPMPIVQQSAQLCSFHTRLVAALFFAFSALFAALAAALSPGAAVSLSKSSGSSATDVVDIFRSRFKAPSESDASASDFDASRVSGRASASKLVAADGVESPCGAPSSPRRSLCRC